MPEWLIPLLESIGSFIVTEIIDEAGKRIIQVFTDNDSDGEPDTEEPAFSIQPDQAALDKPFSTYTVSEALLLIIAFAAVVTMLSHLFRRRKF